MWHDNEEYVDDGQYDAQYYYSPAPEYDMRSVDMRMHRDMDYDQPQKNYIIPEVIKNFLLYFQKSITDQNLYEIQNAYENGFNKLTDRFFKSSPWPEAETVAKVVHGDQLFVILYKELYYRHVYARVQ